MAARMDPITEALLSRVTWEWQDLETIVQELIPLVAPGKAQRTYDANRESYKRRKPATREYESRRLTEAEQRASGARSIVMARITQQRNTGRIEIEGPSDAKRVRFRERRVASQREQGEGPVGLFGSKGEEGTTPDPLHDEFERLRRDLTAWQASVTATLDQLRRTVEGIATKQGNHARTVDGQIQGLVRQVDALQDLVTNPSGGDVDRVLDSLRNDVKVLHDGVAANEQALLTLVSRLTGAVQAAGVFGEERTTRRN